MARKTKDIVKRQRSSIVDYKAVFESPVGQKVLWDLMKFTGFLSPSHTIGDPYSTAFNDGQKNTILHIMKKLKFDQEKLQKQIDEGIEDDQDIFSPIG